MARADMAEFDLWLIELLHSLDVDGEVYGGYISGTLGAMDDVPQGEIEEALADILIGCVEDGANCTSLANQIAVQWKQHLVAKREEKQAVSAQDQLSEVHSQAKQQVKPMPGHGSAATSSGSRQRVGLTAREKQKLIEQYGCESEGDDDDVIPDPGGGGGGGGGGHIEDLFQNTNVSTILAAERLKRDQQKAAHVAKQERDRKSREVQKQRAQERKEKEKKRTQKQERRR